MTVNNTKVNNLKTSLDNAYASKSHTHTGYESSSNKVTSLSSSSTDTQYPSAKSVYDALQGAGGGNYIYDFYHDSSTDDIVLEYDSASGGVSGGSVDIVTSWESTLSDEKVPSEKLVKETINALSVPSASVSTPLVDVTGGAIGSSTSYAKADHQHPLSTAYASSSHDHDSDYLAKASTDTGFVKSNGNIVAFGTTSGTVSEGNHTHGNLTSDGKVGSNANYIVITGTGGAITSTQKLGNITYDGKIGSTSGKPLITTTSGTVTTGSFGSTSGTFAEGNHSHSGYVSATKVTSWSSTVSDSNVPSEKLVKDYIDNQIGTAIQYIQQ